MFQILILIKILGDYKLIAFMKTASLMKNRISFQCSQNSNHQLDFTAILSFVTEMCEVPFAFISQFENENQIITNLIGIEINTIPEEITLNINSVIKKNSLYTIPKDKKYSKLQYGFFTGMPLYDDENLVIGSICIMDVNHKILSPIQLKTFEHCAQQIQFKLDLEKKNRNLLHIINEKEIQLQLFIENSKEIVYEINPEGILTYVSKNWRTFLGYELDEVIGKSNASFLHPDDLDLVNDFLKKTIEAGNNEDEITYRIAHKAGHYLWYTSSLKLVKKNDKLVYFGNCRDVTEQIIGHLNIIKQKELYEKILDKIPTDIAVFDNNHRYIYLNPFAIKNDELREFIIGKNDFEYAKHTGRNSISAQKRRIKFIEAEVSKSLIEWEEKFIGLDGETTYHTRKFNPVLKEDGTLDMMVGFGNNITELKNRELEIIKSKQLLSSILENVAVGILVQGPQSEIIENNASACEMLGLTQEQLIGKTSYDEHWKITHLDGTEFKPDDHPVPQALKQLKPIKNVVMGVYRTISNDIVWLIVDAIPVFDKLGDLLYVVCSFNDISDLKKIEYELKISNERFSYSSQATSDAIWDWNILTDEIFVGDSYTEIFGHRFKNNIITGVDCENFVHPGDREAYYKHVDEVLKSKANKWSYEYRYLKSDGSYATINDKAVIIRNNEGKAIRMIGAMQDITSKKKLENQLRQSEEWFKGTFDHSPAGMAVMSTDGYWVEVNNRSCEILGYTKEELKKLRFQDISFLDDLAEDLANKERLDSGEMTNFTREKKYIRKDKSIVWVLLSVSLLRDKNGEILNYISQIIDITENKLLIEENNKNKTIQLNEAKNLYRLLADNTIDLVCLHNLDATFQYVSPSVKNLVGYEPEELMGKTPNDYVHPEDLKRFYERLNGSIYNNEYKVQEFRFRNKNGEYIWLEITATIVEENGIPLSFQTTARDVTERKEAKQITEKALEKERELNELRSNLVSTISHEFRTPMTTIRTSTELINMYLESNIVEKKQKIDKQLNTITNEIDRIIELMNSVLTISKEDTGKTNFNPTLFDLKKLCFDVIETSYSNQKDGRKVEIVFDGTSFNVFADKNLMKYSLFNLLNNAFKYSEGTGNVILHLSTSQSKVTLQVIDKGIGIPKADQDKLFNTFFRASNTNGIQGTGLGLYIVKTFTEKNSGNITLKSKQGKGTTVYLQFPIQQI